MTVSVTGGCMQELKELAALAYRDTTNENREFWRNEMGNALRDLQQVYDDKLEATRNDVETYYNLKVLQSHNVLFVNFLVVIYFSLVFATSFVCLFH